MINRILQIRDIPSRLSATEDGIHNGGSEYSVDTNVVGVAGEEGSFTQVTVAQGSSDLFYYCVFHRGMGGRLDATESSSNDPTDAPSIEVGDDTFLESPFLEALAMTSLLVDQAMTQ